MNKAEIVDNIIEQLEQELASCLTAADNAHSAATDDQSVAETQYDTLAIEASYLAEGQANRAAEIKEEIALYHQLVLRDYDQEQEVGLTALVQLAGDKEQQQWFFIGPASGGHKVTITSGKQSYYVTIVTPKSPMAKALIGKYCYDEVVLANQVLDEIIAVL